MEYILNQNIPCQIIKIGEKNVNIKATIYFETHYLTIIKMYDITNELAKYIRSQQYCCSCAFTDDAKYFSMFDLSIYKYEQDLYSGTYTCIELMTSDCIIGSNPCFEDQVFKYFSFEITDGYELIGLSTYDINKGYNQIKNLEHVDIPIKKETIYAKTLFGDFSFCTLPFPSFDTNGLMLGFKHSITFVSNTPLSVSEFRFIFDDFINFLELLCGEVVTINKLIIYEEREEYEFIGLCNFPKDKLLILKPDSSFSANFSRNAIFKISDFSNIGFALNKWFEISEQITLANKSFEGILLDEDKKIVTHSKFLASMQLVEGYNSAYINEKEEIDKFNNKKEEIIKSITENGDYREFLSKNCIYIGNTFRKSLKDFTFKSISVLQNISKTKFTNKYDNLIEKIKDERDIYTHSSNRCQRKFNIIELDNIAMLYKNFYRINILSYIGLNNELIKNRFSYDTYFVEYLKRIFDIELAEMGKTSEFDKVMRHFS